MAETPPAGNGAPAADGSESPRTAPQISAPSVLPEPPGPPADAPALPANTAAPSAGGGLVDLPAVTRGWLLLYCLFWYGVLLGGLSVAVHLLPASRSWLIPLLLMAPILLRAAFAPQRLSAAVFHDRWRGFGLSALEGLGAAALLLFWLGAVIVLRKSHLAVADYLVAGEDVPANWSDFLGGMAAVAIGEELFFRGFLQHELSLALLDRPHLTGWRLGRGYLLATALFAVAHVIDQGALGLLTFFPALVFGWLYSRRRQIVGPAFFHFACNILVAVAVLTGALPAPPPAPPAAPPSAPHDP